MSNAQFDWKCEPKAEALVLQIVQQCCDFNPFIANLQQQLQTQTSTRLFDWVDHVVVSHSEKLEKQLEEAGFVSEQASILYRVFRHPGAQLPSVVLQDKAKMESKGIAVSVENIADFLMVRGMTGRIEGSPFGAYRRCAISIDNQTILWIVERRGTQTMEPTHEESQHTIKYLEMKEKWKTRPRNLEDEDEAMSRTIVLAEELVEKLGQNMAAWVVLECEREYWQARNLAGQTQKNRQDRLGMGWANHDHHTFRSSRRRFALLVRLFEMLGFHCRERFYAGQEAGWGAQVMENTQAKLVLFLDVDLSPDEVMVDFAHQPLPEMNKLGTVGLWCALHGDSILQAGMHHLEAQFLFEELRDDLKQKGVGMMDPFSNFTYLRQAFTTGELWHPDPKKVEKIAKAGLITPEQAQKFVKQGAVGSHLENLQRREGYKGFNQKNVSFIIRKTDPRTVETAYGD